MNCVVCGHPAEKHAIVTDLDEDLDEYSYRGACDFAGCECSCYLDGTEPSPLKTVFGNDQTKR